MQVQQFTSLAIGRSPSHSWVVRVKFLAQGSNNNNWALHLEPFNYQANAPTTWLLLHGWHYLKTLTNQCKCKVNFTLDSHIYMYVVFYVGPAIRIPSYCQVPIIQLGRLEQCKLSSLIKETQGNNNSSIKLGIEHGAFWLPGQCSKWLDNFNTSLKIYWAPNILPCHCLFCTVYRKKLMKNWTYWIRLTHIK